MVRSLGQEDPLEKEMATLSSILAWKTTWTEESGGLQSIGFQKESYMTQQLNKKYCREYANLPFNLFLKAFGNKKMIQEQRMPSCLTINKQCNTFTIYMHDPCSLNLRSAAAAAAKSLQSCPTLCDPIDSSPPGSSVPGILQARTLEWVAISFSNA